MNVNVNVDVNVNVSMTVIVNGHHRLSYKEYFLNSKNFVFFNPYFITHVFIYMNFILNSKRLLVSKVDVSTGK